MKLTRKVAILIISIITLTNLLLIYTDNGKVWSFLLSILLLSISGLFIIKQYRTIEQYKNLEVEYENVKKEKVELLNRYKVYEQFFTTFDEAIFFSFNYAKKHYIFSKGVEKLLGYTQAEFNENLNILKSIVHKENMHVLDEIQRELVNGYSVRKEIKIIHPQQGEKWLLIKAQPYKNSDGFLETVNGQFEDITRQKELELELRQMAFFDELTDIPNRKMLDRQINKALFRSKRHKHNFSIMFIDLDDFKKVNDTLGHDAGDQLLIEVVSRINDCVREEDLVSRIGGDEFIVMFEETGKNEIELIAKRIIKYVGEPYTINDHCAKISLSIGISMYPDDGEDKDTLIKAADKAMYYAKNNGKNNYRIYTKDLNDFEISEKGIFKKWMEVLQNPFR